MAWLMVAWECCGSYKNGHKSEIDAMCSEA